MVRFLIFLLIMSALVGFIWHDKISVWLTDFGNRAAEQAPTLINEQAGNLQDWWEQTGKSSVDQFVADLTDSGKDKIDQWLQDKNLNQYGDSEDTVYAGGTPLFNELTGESINRYVYLLEKFPELASQLNLDQYLK